jgi:DNA polymerase III alpha subunit
MDDKICHFNLAEANAARKIVGKKQMNKIPELYKKIINQAPNPNFGEYVYETAVKPQLGYSFSAIHSLEYSYIGIQTVVLATKFPEIY